jgi:hypothetical protein
MLDAMTKGRNRSYTQTELGEVGDGLERLLDTINRGELTAGGWTPRKADIALYEL